MPATQSHVGKGCFSACPQRMPEAPPGSPTRLQMPEKQEGGGPHRLCPGGSQGVPTAAPQPSHHSGGHGVEATCLASMEKQEASQVGALRISSTNWKSLRDITDMTSNQEFSTPGEFLLCICPSGASPHPHPHPHTAGRQPHINSAPTCGRPHPRHLRSVGFRQKRLLRDAARSPETPALPPAQSLSKGPLWACLVFCRAG